MKSPHKTDCEVLSYIVDHIGSFHCEEPHLMQTKNIHEKCLSLFPSLKKNKLYLEWTIANATSEKFECPGSTYSRVHSSKFNLSFGHIRSNTCTSCELEEFEKLITIKKLLRNSKSIKNCRSREGDHSRNSGPIANHVAPKT